MRTPFGDVHLNGYPVCLQSERKASMGRLFVRKLILTIVSALLISGRLEGRPQQETATEPDPTASARAADPQAAAPAPAPAPAQAPDQTSPLQIKIGEATITPVGFMDLTNTFRSTNSGTSLQT